VNSKVPKSFEIHVIIFITSIYFLLLHGGLEIELTGAKGKAVSEAYENASVLL